MPAVSHLTSGHLLNQDRMMRFSPPVGGAWEGKPSTTFQHVMPQRKAKFHLRSRNEARLSPVPRPLPQEGKSASFCPDSISVLMSGFAGGFSCNLIEITSHSFHEMRHVERLGQVGLCAVCSHGFDLSFGGISADHN